MTVAVSLGSPQLGDRDPLTGAYSRSTFNAHLRTAVEHALAHGESLSLLVIDLDYFKSVNDAFGHSHGDQVLVEFVARMHSLASGSDLVFRYGGDEFMIVLPKTTKAQAIQTASQLLQGVASTFWGRDHPLYLTVSIGVATFPQEAHSAQELFEIADMRVCEAKRRGRAQVVSDEVDRTSSHLLDSAGLPLVERHPQLQRFYDFLHALQARKRGIFVATGAPGGGKTRFLTELAAIARARGWQVVELRGMPQHGAVAVNTPTPTEVLATLRATMESRREDRLLLCVDDLPQLDWSDLEQIRSSFRSLAVSQAGLVYTADRKSARRIYPLEAPLRDAVELPALSRKGTKTLLQLRMQWEPPQHFVDWFFQQTQGLPGLIQAGIQYLVRRGVLQKEEEDWTFSREFRQITLAEKLQGPQQLPPHNLPLIMSSFVGREREMQEIRQLLEDHRLITLTGPGGIGKTRLALQVAAEEIERYPHGVYFIPLSSVESADLLLPTVAEILGITFHSQQNQRLQFLNHLRARSMLLLLDSFERLVQEAALLVEILQNAPGIKMLVTSQERLNLQGEWVFEVKELPFPKDKTVSDWESFGAMQLFLHSAYRVQPEFTLTAKEVPHVARICQLVNGIPLAIELAAAWVRELTCAEIAAKIEHTLDFLTATEAVPMERHQSLRAVFDYSWNLLSEEEQKLFRRLSVFQGAFQRAAAIEVAGASLFTLSALVHKSLVHKQASGEYTLQNVLRQYAAAQLAEDAGERHEVQERLCHFYASFLKDRAARLYTEQQREVLEDVAAEIENIRAGWNWAVEQKALEPLNDYCHSLFRFYEVWGWAQEGESAFARAADALLAPKQDPSQLDAWEQVLWAKLVARQARFCIRSAQYNKARTLLQISLPILQQHDQIEQVAFALKRLGEVAYYEGEYAVACRYYEESLALSRQLNDQQAIARTWIDLAYIAYTLGDFDQARQHCQEGLEISMAIRNRRGIASAFDNLGLIASTLGEYDEAKRCYEASLEAFREIGDSAGIAYTLNNLSSVLYRLNEHSQARQACQEGLEICRRNSDRYGIAVSLNNLGNIAQAVADFTQARELCEQSLNLFQEIQHPYGVAYVHNSLGNICCFAGDYAASQEHFLEAIRIALEIRTQPLVAESLFGLAILCAQTGRKEQASELLTFTLRNANIVREAADRSRYLSEELRAHISRILEGLQADDQPVNLEKIATTLLTEFGKSTSADVPSTTP